MSLWGKWRWQEFKGVFMPHSACVWDTHLHSWHPAFLLPSSPWPQCTKTKAQTKYPTPVPLISVSLSVMAEYRAFLRENSQNFQLNLVNICADNQCTHSDGLWSNKHLKHQIYFPLTMEMLRISWMLSSYMQSVTCRYPVKSDMWKSGLECIFRNVPIVRSHRFSE